MPIATDSAAAVRRAAQNPSPHQMLDAALKQLLALKGVLAAILQGCVPEFEGESLQDIANKYIEGEPEIGSVGVYPDETNVKESIVGLNTEDTTVTEGRVTYDIRFRARAPKSHDSVELIINVEAQNNAAPGYSLVTRAVYYCCRMISAQKGVEFAGEHFDDIKKVYSIWICPKPQAEKRGTIVGYDMAETPLLGSSTEDRQHYDLLAIRMIYLPGADGEEGEGFMRALDGLLSPQKSTDYKLNLLQEDFKIPATHSIRNEVQTMCDYSTVVEQAGVERGLKRGLEQGREEGLVQGREEGLEQGREEGLEQGKTTQAKTTAHKMHARGIAVSDIAEMLGFPVETVQAWLEEKLA